LRSQAIKNPKRQPGPANIQSSNQFYKQTKIVTTLRNRRVLENLQEKEKVSTNAR